MFGLPLAFSAIDRALKEARATRILDVGCGTGRWARALSRRGYDVTGIERNRWKSWIAGVCARQATILTASLEKFEPEGLFDAAILIGVIHSTPPEMRVAILEKSLSLVNQGGVICVLDFASLDDQALSHRDRWALCWYGFEERIIGLVDPAHYAAFRDSLEQGGAHGVARAAGGRILALNTLATAGIRLTLITRGRR